jgi:hypothetical protein
MQVFLIVRIDCATQPSVSEDPASAILVSTDDVNASGQRLEEYDAETLASTRHDEHIRKPEIIGQFFRDYRAHEPNPFRHSYFCSKCLEARAVIAVANNNV